MLSDLTDGHAAVLFQICSRRASTRLRLAGDRWARPRAMQAAPLRRVALTLRQADPARHRPRENLNPCREYSSRGTGEGRTP